ncbi:MAG: zinc ribbon domain-containing protein [Spirochaetales bacterium]|nr:zinc ribbon domain-containing protein [Spirochaetales bacterium]
MSDNMRKAEWNGVVKKCPNCGEVLSSMSAFCPNCGHELSERQSSNTVKVFSQTIQMYKDILAEIEEKQVTDEYSKYDKKREIQGNEETMVSYISNVLIPNTVEDITELMLYAVENVQLEINKPTQKGLFNDKRKTIVEDAWLFLLDRCYCKAEFAFEGTKEFDNIERIYRSIHKVIKKANIQVWITFFIMIMIAIGVGIGLRFAFNNIVGIIAGIIVGWLEIHFFGPIFSIGWGGNVKLE